MEWRSGAKRAGRERPFLTQCGGWQRPLSSVLPSCGPAKLLLAHSGLARCRVDGGGPLSGEVATGQPDLFRMPRKPWNAGRMTGAKAPLKPKHIWAIRQHLKSLGSVRDLAMFNTALDAKLRGCDLVKLRLADVAHGGVIRQRSTIVQQKTGRTRTLRNHRASEGSAYAMARPPRSTAG